MHSHNIAAWRHDHIFGNDDRRHAESKTLLVVAVTFIFMVVEISAGIAYQSMALLADGVHMASHAAALGISAAAYIYARRKASDDRYAFGVGKVNSLAAFASAVVLFCFAAAMIAESIGRLISPVTPAYDQALIVACLGLAVNLFSAYILSSGTHHPDHKPAGNQHHDHDRQHDHGDQNLRAAYLHVVADALTSILAIIALIAAKLDGWVWADPAMGIVGGLIVLRWSAMLLRDTSRILLDHQAPPNVLRAITESIERETTDRVTDLHVWRIGQHGYAAEIALVTDEVRAPEMYKRLIPSSLNISHITVEVNRCPVPH